ncbi:MAG TPA: universal stress protein [Terriglobales bacterium]|jgi:nucleotide-binding universal stress UspA family protein|nr:universal stress protein [Terriglobales bacterium]
MKIKKILAPSDLSKLSRTAVRYAMELALDQHAEVIVYNVITEDSDWFEKDDELNPTKALMPKQKQRLAEFVKESCAEFLGKITVRQLVETGLPYRDIVRKAEDEKADLIVMSTHGRTGLEQFMLGSVTAKVVARATCPVLSIRPPK